jgi:hypothetical protein
LPLPVEQDDDHGGVVGIAPAGCPSLAIPSPAGSLLDALLAGHPERQASELVLWPT